jgi:hypothetical protein
MMGNEIAFENAAPTPDFLGAPTLNFYHPSEVLGHPALTVAERRAILAAWASDAHAVEDAPWLRQLENGARIPVSEIFDALIALDREEQGIDATRAARAIAAGVIKASAWRAMSNRRSEFSPSPRADHSSVQKQL